MRFVDVPIGSYFKSDNKLWLKVDMQYWNRPTGLNYETAAVCISHPQEYTAPQYANHMSNCEIVKLMVLA